MKKELIAQMIGANLPDNNTKAITPEKLRQVENAMASTFDGNRASTGMFNVYWNGQGADTEIFFQFLGAGTLVEADKSMYALCFDYYSKKTDSNKNRANNFKSTRSRWRCALPSGNVNKGGLMGAALGSPFLLSELGDEKNPTIVLSWFTLMGESNDHSDAEIRIPPGEDANYVRVGANHNAPRSFNIFESRRNISIVNMRGYDRGALNAPIKRMPSYPTLYVRAALVRYRGSSRTPTLSQIGSSHERVYVSDVVAIQCKPSADSYIQNGIESIQWGMSNRIR